MLLLSTMQSSSKDENSNRTKKRATAVGSVPSTLSMGNLLKEVATNLDTKYATHRMLERAIEAKRRLLGRKSDSGQSKNSEIVRANKSVNAIRYSFSKTLVV